MCAPALLCSMLHAAAVQSASHPAARVPVGGQPGPPGVRQVLLQQPVWHPVSGRMDPQACVTDVRQWPFLTACWRWNT